ncbi:MAG: phosphopyruvate hydratase [Patescibacteria group bacterium]|nr:phosphopyruvate hydratase [Patescibacteria group bacterium]
MSKFTIKEIRAREILDSRSNPTIEAEVILQNGVSAKAGVPSGASTGRHEALELRDKDKKRYNGLGVLKVVKNVNTKINRLLKGIDVRKQEEIDKKLIALDNTKNKKNIGANAILGTSLACCRAAAEIKKEPLYRYISNCFKFKNSPNIKLPIPMFNIFNGGVHADTNLDFQEFMVVPMAKKVSEKRRKLNKNSAEYARMGSEIFKELGKVLKERGLDTDVGNEGGYAPDIYSSIQAVDMIIAAIMRAGYMPGKDVGISIDVGSSVLYDERKKKYIFKLDNATFTNTTLIGLYHEWFRKYPIISIEDGLAEDDWQGWQEFTELLEDEIMIIGDDLFVTNIDRLKEGIKKGAANAILIKPNQIGTLTETIQCVKLAQENNYKVIVSHRSGETNDDFIADLAVGIGADYLKAGAPNRGERVAKYNRLMKIEELLNSGI